MSSDRDNAGTFWNGTVRKILSFQWIAWLGTGVEVLVLFLLHHHFGLSKPVAGAIAIEVAILHNFTWYYVRTWSDEVRHTIPDFFRRMLEYNVYTALVDAFTNYFVYVGLIYLGVHYIPAALAGKLLGPVGKYVVNEYLVFHSSVEHPESISSTHKT